MQHTEPHNRPAYSFRIHVGILSAPHALEVFRDSSILAVSCTEMIRNESPGAMGVKAIVTDWQKVLVCWASFCISSPQALLGRHSRLPPPFLKPMSCLTCLHYCRGLLVLSSLICHISTCPSWSRFLAAFTLFLCRGYSRRWPHFRARSLVIIVPRNSSVTHGLSLAQRLTIRTGKVIVN